MTMFLLFYKCDCDKNKPTVNEYDDLYKRIVFSSENNIDSVQYYFNSSLYLTENNENCVINSKYFSDSIGLFEKPTVTIKDDTKEKNLKVVNVSFNNIHYSFWKIKLLNKYRFKKVVRKKLENLIIFSVKIDDKNKYIFQLERSFKNKIVNYKY